jgi:DNA adenine methylase
MSDITDDFYGDLIIEDAKIVEEMNYKSKVKHLKTAPKSLLRYPGGKTRGAKEILKYFPSELDRICSPFIGGGSIELELANKGIQVFGYDIFEPLTSFWQVLLEDPKELMKLVRKYYPLTNSKFYSLQSKYMGIKNKKERAAVFFVLNRASFSGTTLSGGMSPGHPRFTPQIINRLAEFKIDNLTVENADYHNSLAKHTNDFLYLDPPYANNGKLYGERGDVHESFDHEGLAEILIKRNGWILSYNDCETVRGLYEGFNKINLKWAYGMNNDKKSNELLILSKDFISI